MELEGVPSLSFSLCLFRRRLFSLRKLDLPQWIGRGSKSGQSMLLKSRSHSTLVQMSPPKPRAIRHTKHTRARAYAPVHTLMPHQSDRPAKSKAKSSTTDVERQREHSPGPPPPTPLPTALPPFQPGATPLKNRVNLCWDCVVTLQRWHIC
jgi:hypothetical protein